jgi:hypothetical protein
MRRFRLSQEGKITRIEFSEASDGRIAVRVYEDAYRLQALALEERENGFEARALRLEALADTVGGSALELISMD